MNEPLEPGQPCAASLRTWGLALAVLGLLGCRTPRAGAQEPAHVQPNATFIESEPGVDAPDQRVYPEDAQGCAECPAGGCVGLDCDGDGIGDHNDACPSVAEDLDGFEDVDGCPDLDNDGDGVADLDDPCPMQAGKPGGAGCP